MTERTVAEAARLFREDEERRQVKKPFKDWLPHQVDAFKVWDDNGVWPPENREPLAKMCVYYPTGTGKTKIMLACVWLRGDDEVLVIAPPSTHNKWVAEGAVLGLRVTAVSHQKFRQPDFKISRQRAVICDEVHLLGGQSGKGFKKFDRAARGLQAPLILGSATPNWNDAERCYCIEHLIQPESTKGGFIEWLYVNCHTHENPFGRIPIVDEFRAFANASEYLDSLPGVVYLPDNAPDILRDVPLDIELGDEFETYHVDHTRERLMASDMEIRQRRRYHQIVDPETGRIREDVWDMLATLVGDSITPTMIFCAHSEIAKKLASDLQRAEVKHGYVDGNTTTKNKHIELENFKAGVYDVLVGTASIATGPDGIDKMCDTMVIVDDTDDASLRRQLLGRILPRGVVEPEDYVGKVAYRFVYPG